MTDDDLVDNSGRRDQLEGKSQYRYDYGKDRVNLDIGDWYGRQHW
jgi:uncharacterized protein YjbJ (UPF0337 family)